MNILFVVEVVGLFVKIVCYYVDIGLVDVFLWFEVGYRIYDDVLV